MKGKLFKKLCAWLLSVMVILGAGVVNIIPFVGEGLLVSAQDYYDSFDYVVTGNTIEITGYKGNKTDVVIPKSWYGYKVTSIGDFAFSRKQIRSVTIPDTVTCINVGAFYSCEELTTVTFANGLTKICNNAFGSCKKLMSIEIPDSVNEIEYGAFNESGWYNAQPSGSVYAGKFYYAYKGEMPNNTAITIKDGTKGIVQSSFNGCHNLISVTIPDGLTSIGSYAFKDCTNLKNIDVPASVTNVKHSIFANCTGLTNATIGSDISPKMFLGCTHLKKLKIVYGSTAIKSSAFTDCVSLEEVYLPRSVENISNDAFQKYDEKYITKLYCFSDSFGLSYARAQGFPYIIRSDQLENISTISCETIKPGESITVVGDANGGDENYKYAVYYKEKNTSNWTTVQSYQVNWTVKFVLNSTGDYNIRVNVADASGTIVRKDFVVKVTSDFQNVSKLGANKILLGEKVKVRCFAEGGSAPYQYAVYYKKSSAAVWSKLRGYATGNILTLTPKAATSYDIRVDIKDADGTVASKTLKLTVNKTFANTSVLNTDSIKLGEKVKVRCFAEGGTSPYQYAVYYKKHSLTSWTKLRGYDEKNIVVLTPTAATTYDVRVDAADSAGNIATKTLTLKVTK